MDKNGVLEARVFILLALVFIVLFVALLVAAVITSNQEEKQINRAGGNIHRNFIQQLSSFFNGEELEDIIKKNDPDSNNDGIIDASSNIDPQGDEDGDGIPNIDDLDMDGDGILNSQDSFP